MTVQAPTTDDRFISMTDPAYYTTATSEDERQLRADFVTWRSQAEAACSIGWEPLRARTFQAVSEIAARWENHEARHWRDVWEHLHAATTAWDGEPETMRRTCRLIAERQALGRESIEPIRWRNYQQAAEMTGNGTWERPAAPETELPEECLSCDGTGLDDCDHGFFVCSVCEGSGYETPAPPRDLPWANAAEISTAAPVPVSSGFAAARTRELAESIPGHAFAGLVNNLDRGQEMER